MRKDCNTDKTGTYIRNIQESSDRMREMLNTLLKFIPGAGTVIGGAISASTAAIITGALGEAYIKIMEQIWLGDMELDELASEVGRKKMVALFKSELSLENRKK